MRSGTKLYYVGIAIALVVVVMYAFNLKPSSAPSTNTPTNTTTPSDGTGAPVNPPVQTPVDHVAKAADLYQQKDFAGAAAEYNLAITATTDTKQQATLYNLLGNTLRDEQKSTDALAAYKQAYTLDATLVAAYINAANVYVTEKNITAAKAVVAEGLKNNPSNTELTNKQAVLDLNGSGVER